MFKESAETPILKDKLNIFSRCWDISSRVNLSILNGKLLGPVELLLFREEIIVSILSFVVGYMEK